jgi:hypothetical protein
MEGTLVFTYILVTLNKISPVLNSKVTLLARIQILERNP